MKKRVFLALMLCAFALARRSAAAEWVYEPFPPIPQSTVITNTYVTAFVTICGKFEQRCARGAPRTGDLQPICDTAPTPGATALPELSASGDQLFEARAESWVYFASSIRQACASIAVGKPLTNEQLAELRRLRNANHRDVLLEIVDGSSIKASVGAVEGLGQAQSSAVSLAIPGFEGLQGRLIQGLADFLAKRAKQEALAFLTKELTDELCTDERKPFFPNTCATIATLDTTRSLGAIRVALKAAVELDLKRLPDFALAWALAHDKATGAAKNSAFLGRVALAFATGLTEQREPLDLVRSLGELPRQACEDAKECEPAGHVVRFTSALVYAAAQGGADWQKPFEQLEKPQATAARAAWTAVALVLLAEERWLATDTGAQPIPKQQIDAFISKPTHVWVVLLDVSDEWKRAIQSSRELNDPADRIALFARTAEFTAGRLTQVFDVSFSLVGTWAPKEALSHALLVARELTSTRASIVQREFAKALAHFTLALREAVPGALPDAWDRHLGLLVEISDAESAEAVSAALEDYAEPLGAYRTKYRQTRVALNGIVGGFVGLERVSTRGVNGNSFALAGFAPVGIHVTTPIGTNGEDNDFHFGLLFSVIDLGAITTYRFDSELSGDLDPAADADAEPKADQAPTVGLEQVVSPGAFLTFGLGGGPIVLGLGASVSPKLREVNDGGATISASALRFGLTVGIDVPIFFAM